MAYELTYFYHEKKPEGGYNTEERKELKKKVGNGFDDIPLEQVAGAIIKQLARRDIWVVDVEVSEYTKKPVSFKESTDGLGIVLKNKKFSLDHSATLVAQDISVDLVPEQAAPTSSTALVKKQVKGNAGLNLVEPPVNPNRIMYWAQFEPHPFTQEARTKGLKFTVGKKYPVHRAKENENGVGQIFYVTDDVKKMVQVDEKYFQVAGAGLVGDDEVEGGFSPQGPPENEPKLAYWSHMKGGEAPQLRNGNGNGSGGKTMKDIPEQYRNIPLDDGSIPDSYFNVPDIRKKK